MIKTITLSGGEISVALDGAHAHIRNDSADIVYAAKTAGIAAGADGVASIPAGQAATVRGISGKVYLLGTGSVHIQSDDFVASPFKTSAQAGGSGADDVARAAINAHSGNAEIHVTADDKRNWNMGTPFTSFNGHVSDNNAHTTAEEKAAWNAKADISDIPAALPANGGNSDTVGGFSVSNNGICGVLKITSDYGVSDIGRHLDFYTGSGQPFSGRITRDDNGFWFFNSDDTKAVIFADIDGNATMLGSRPAEDYVLKSDYNVLKTDFDALAERVAALESAASAGN